MSEEPLLIATDGPLQVLRLNRPEKRNALSHSLRTRMIEALDDAANDEHTGAVLVTAAGDSFCAGFDLAELSSAPEPAAVFAEARRYHHRLHTFPKPLIAAIGGPALAGGFDLALLCDLRIASNDATFGQPQVRRGIPASYDLMAHVLGVPTARKLCLTGRIITAGEAHKLHLVAEVTTADDLLARATTMAREAASSSLGARTKAQFVAHQPNLYAAGSPVT